MSNNTSEFLIMFDLLAQAVLGKRADAEEMLSHPVEISDALYSMAQKHDLAHLVAHAVEGLDIPDCEVLTKLKNAKMRAIYRYARMDYEYERVCNILEDAQIPFVPMKGVITRTYYPEPWMRTSCDIDILVKEADLKRAADILSRHNWFIRGEVNHHDVHMQTASGVHLDLHYSIKGNIDAPDAVLDRVWQYCMPAENKQYEHRQTNEFFIYHLIAHTSRHFLSEGCGVRPFLDIWLLRQKMTWNQETLEKLCKEAGLEVFWMRMLELSDVWFGEKKHTQITQKMEQYILNSDKQTQAYNAVLFNQVRSGQSAHWGSRLFLSYDLLKTTYPILEKHRWLLPVFQVVRWFKKLNDGRIRRIRQKQQVKQAVQTEDLAEAKQLLQEMGLDK